MKYDIVAVYNCISEKTNFIVETTKDIKNLKKDLEKEERKVDIATVQYSILKSLIGLHEMDNDTPYMVSKVIGKDIFKHLNPDVYTDMLLKDYRTMTYYSVSELIKFKPYIEETDTDIFSVIGPIIKLTPNGDVKYFKFIYNGVQGSVYISKNDKGINSVALVYNNTCAFFDTDKGNDVLEFSYDNMCYGKLMSHIIDKVSNE